MAELEDLLTDQLTLTVAVGGEPGAAKPDMQIARIRLSPASSSLRARQAS